MVILRCTPCVLLLCDFFANRIYLPLTVTFGYSFIAYGIWTLVFMIKDDVEFFVPLPELNYFILVEPMWLAFYLPLIIFAGTYAALRLKFLYMEEGDEVFNFSVWAKQAN